MRLQPLGHLSTGREIYWLGLARKLSGKKIKAPAKETGTRPSNVIDLVEILRQSLNQKGGGEKSTRKSSSKTTAKKAAKAVAKHRKAA